MQYAKWFKREARIITETFDNKLADDIKPESGLSDDGWGGLHHQVDEQNSAFPLEKRKQFIEYIAENYKVEFDIEDKEIDIGKCSIRFLEYYSTQFAGTMSLRDLTDMHSIFFRKKIGEILSAIPSGIQDFRGLAEKSPYIFN